MAEPTFKFDKSAVEKHLDTVEKETLTFAGKPKFNPYLWIAGNIHPVRNKLAAPGFTALTEAETKAALSLKCPYVAEK